MLPAGFNASLTYDKWGNEVLPNGSRKPGPLFGDPDFWLHMRDFYPASFNCFVDFLAGLPRDFRSRNYDGARLNPVQVVQDLFPQAHEIIHQVREDFVPAPKEPVRRSFVTAWHL